MRLTVTRISLAALAIAVALCFSGPADAAALRAYIDGPIVIGDQVFKGGMVELAPIGQAGLVAVRIDGRQIALAFRGADAPRIRHARVDIVFRRDGSGFHHLVGLRGAASQEVAPLRVATVTTGLAPLNPARAEQDDQVFRAQR